MSATKKTPASGSRSAAGVRLETICVTTDFSETAKLALSYAAIFAERFNASVHVLHVLHELGPGVPSVDYTACCETARSYFAASEPGLPKSEAKGADPVRHFLQCLETKIRNRLQELVASSPLAGLPVVISIRYGHPVEEICRYAQKNAVDLLVLGAHGRTGVEYFMMGSVAERVVRVSPCPVLTVRFPRPPATKEGQELTPAEAEFRHFSATRS